VLNTTSYSLTMSINPNIQVVCINIPDGLLRIFKQAGAPDFLITGLNTLPHPRGAAHHSGGAGNNPAPRNTEFTVTMREADRPDREEGERRPVPPGSSWNIRG